MQIAPRTYYAWLSRGPSRRALWELALTEMLAGFYDADEHGRRPPESLYGAVKMWAHLNRLGIPVARCTVERLMRANMLARRAPRPSHPHHHRQRGGESADLVDRQFQVDAPNRLFVADFTYVPLTGGGFVYTAFVIDAFAGTIAGWYVSHTANATMVARPWPTPWKPDAARPSGQPRRRAPLRRRHPVHLDRLRPAPHRGRHCSPPSAASATPTTTPWPKPPSASTRPNAHRPDRPSTPA